MSPAPVPPAAAGHETSSGPFTRVVERNIVALLERRREDDRNRRGQDRAADAITRFTGSMTFVYLHLAFYAAWIATNLGLVPGLGRLQGFDDGFTVLAMAASVEAIFLSTFVLISQNRMQALADKRADLDLQVSLLAEHEVTELIRMVRGMAARMGVPEAADPELDELAQDVQPEVVLTHIEEAEARVLGRPGH
jgi:uncharacterized membrane protein